MNNPNFNFMEFHKIKNQAGSDIFSLSSEKSYKVNKIFYFKTPHPNPLPASRERGLDRLFLVKIKVTRCLFLFSVISNLSIDCQKKAYYYLTKNINI